MKIFVISLLAAFSLFGQSAFRFAHISDTHIGSATAAEDLRRTVADINTDKTADFVIITGDITEAGFDDQFRQAKQILDSLLVPWYIIPGNHDMKWSGSGGYSFQKIFGYERIVFDRSGYRFIGMHQGPVLKMGDGHWSPQDLKWLDSVLAKTPVASPVIFFTHYPLDPGIANWYEVLDRLKKFNVHAVIYGHGHRNRAERFEGIAGVMGRSNLRSRDSVGGYNCVEVRNDSMFYAERRPFLGEVNNWLKFRLGKKNIAQTDFPRPDYTVNDSFPSVRTVWKKETGYTIASTPAVWKENLIVGNASGQVLSFDANSGKEIWSFFTGAPVYSSPAVEKNSVVFGSTDSTVYCLDAVQGNLRWKYKTDASIVASPIIRSGVAYIGSSDGKFRAFTIDDGVLRWEYSGIGGFVECVPAQSDGKIVFGAWDEHLYCLDAETGIVLWKWNSGRRGTLLSPAACEPVIAKGKVFIVAPDRFMTAIDLETGRTVWRTNQFQVRESIGGSEDGKRVYVRTMNDSIYAVSAEAHEPSVVWSLDAGFGYDINSAMLKEKNGSLFYPTKNGLVMAIDGMTGKLKWKYKTGVGVTNTLLPLSDKNVVVTDLDGVIQMINLKE